jgi:hypothetical protein
MGEEDNDGARMDGVLATAASDEGDGKPSLPG